MPVKDGASASSRQGADRRIGNGYADKSPFRFTGLIHDVTFDLRPHLSARDEDAVQTARYHGIVAHGAAG